jgi:predicted ArsR family transcriptional regulator
MNLTSRQQTFLDKLFDLYREFQGPVHYSLVAEKLGVNKFSAYDMLKLLEEKGVAASEYVVDQEQAGPGRSMIRFYPTNQAARFLTLLRDEVRSSEEWRQIKESITRRLGEARDGNPTKALQEALSRLTEAKTPLVYCAEMISALLINLERVRDELSENNLFRAWSASNLTGEISLGALAGLSLGSAMLEAPEDPTLPARLVGHLQTFQTQLSRLNDNGLSTLSQFVKDALATFEP